MGTQKGLTAPKMGIVAKKFTSRSTNCTNPSDFHAKRVFVMMRSALAISLMAVFVFGERPSPMQMAGMALGVVAVALIAWPQGGKA